MATDPNLQRALKSYLRRTYTGNINGLKQLAASTWAQTTESVTITSHTFAEGGASGEITCPRGQLLAAIEDMIAELDPSAARPSVAAVALFR